MKKILMTLLLVVSTLTFKNVYATDALIREKVDFRVYVEDEQGKDVEGLQFTIHDKNNVFSYTSNYENDAKYYYFSKNTFDGNSNTTYSSTIPEIFTTKEMNCLDNNNFDNYFQSERFAVNNGNYGYLNAYYKYLPMILEETSTVDTKTIKIEKVIYGVVHVVPNPNTSRRYDIVFQLINNNVGGTNSEFSYVTPTDSTIRLTLSGNTFEEQVLSTRKKILKYNEEIIDISTGTTITSSEGKEEIYLNRASSPSSSSTSSDSHTNGSKRTASSNVEDFTLATMGDSLPVIVQERIVESPLTLYNGILLFIVLVLLASGITYFSMKSKSKKQETPTEIK